MVSVFVVGASGEVVGVLLSLVLLLSVGSVVMTAGRWRRSLVISWETWLLLYVCMKKMSLGLLFFVVGWSRSNRWSSVGVWSMSVRMKVGERWPQLWQA